MVCPAGGSSYASADVDAEVLLVEFEVEVGFEVEFEDEYEGVEVDDDYGLADVVPFA